MTIELLGLPGAGKSVYAAKLAGANFCSKTDAARHIARNVLKDRILSSLLLSKRLTNRLGLQRHTLILLSRHDRDLRNEAATSLNSLFKDERLRIFLSNDPYEMIDSFYREILLGLYCARENIAVVNDDGAAQRILSMIGLRHMEATAEQKKSACEALVEHLTYVSEIHVITTDPATALQRCRERKGGLPHLLRHMSEDEIQHKFENCAQSIDIITECFARRNIPVRSIAP